MTTQEFIQKIPEELRLHQLGHCKSLSELVLDPEVWKAVSKKEGWGFCKCDNGCQDGHYPYPVGEDGDDVDWGGCIKCVDNGIHLCDDDYKVKMHQMIDALIDGKSLEEYISTL